MTNEIKPKEPQTLAQAFGSSKKTLYSSQKMKITEPFKRQFEVSSRKGEPVTYFPGFTTATAKKTLLGLLNDLAKTEKGAPFVLDDYNSRAIEVIAMWLSNDPDFEKIDPEKKFSLLKGLAIVGPKGTGKTTITQALREFFFQKFRRRLIISHVHEVTDAYMTKNYDLIYRLNDGYRCFDDLGTELMEVPGWGNFPMMVKVLQQRHFLHSMTFITSNLGSKSLCERYGDRFEDQLKDMVNMIPLTGPSRR